jgi:antibiotic biosynthesis monooxygenase (ABM) superfamily enzyme
VATGTGDTEVGGLGPLTVVATWKVRPGMETAFEEWHRGISAAAASFPGHLGVSIMRPGQAAGEYVVIFKFDSYEHLVGWQESAIRREWLHKATHLKADETRYQSGGGLEFWFASPRSSAPPPRWKMAIVTVLGVWPVSILVPKMLAPVIDGLSGTFQALMIAIGIVIVLTWAAMPLLTRPFSRWLFVTSKENTP